VATNALKYWLTGSPYLTTGSSTGNLEYWFHNAPLIHVIVETQTTTCTLQMRACITAPKTLQMRAYIAVNPTFQMRASIRRRQGWPIPDVGDPGSYGFTDTSLRMRGYILSPSLSDQSFSMRGRIRYGATVDLDMRARVVLAQTLQMRACISNRVESKVVGSFKISAQKSYKVVGSFAIPGWYTKQSLQARASIVKVRRSVIPGHFSIIRDTGDLTLQTFGIGQARRMVRSLRIGAGIVKA
jgi:hypothetical protein